MIRDAIPSDFDAILALNAESVQYLSPLTPQRLAHLHGQAAFHRVAVEGDRVLAFLLAFREGASYDSPNYQWFVARFAHFLYIDRIVVAQSAQGRGLGALLYEDLFAFARLAGVPLVTCEFDIEPPNPASARFHFRFGFTEVGSQSYGLPAKRVSLQAAPAGAASQTV